MCVCVCVCVCVKWHCIGCRGYDSLHQYSVHVQYTLYMYAPKHVSMITALVLQTLLAMSIINLPLLIILQDLVRIIDVMKLGNRIGIIGILVGVVLYGQFSVSLLYFTGGGRLTHTQDLVEITSDYKREGKSERERRKGRRERQGESEWDVGRAKESKKKHREGERGIVGGRGKGGGKKRGREGGREGKEGRREGRREGREGERGNQKIRREATVTCIFIYLQCHV